MYHKCTCDGLLIDAIGRWDVIDVDNVDSCFVGIEQIDRQIKVEIDDYLRPRSKLFNKFKYIGLTGLIEALNWDEGEWLWRNWQSGYIRNQRSGGQNPVNGIFGIE